MTDNTAISRLHLETYFTFCVLTRAIIKSPPSNMLTTLTLGVLVLCGITLQVSGADPFSTLCILQCDFAFSSKIQASGCDCGVLKALMMSRTHSEHTTHPHTDHTEHPHHLNHHFTTQEPTTTSTITPAPKTTQELCDILCAMQQGGDACHCLKPGLPGRKWRSFSCYFIFGDY